MTAPWLLISRKTCIRTHDCKCWRCCCWRTCDPLYQKSGLDRQASFDVYPYMPSKSFTSFSFSLHNRFACKTFMVSTVPKKKAQRRILETLRNEIDLLRSLDHPNIVRAYESYEVGQDLHLVMELCRGGGELLSL